MPQVGNSEAFTIFDHLQTPDGHTEFHFELDHRTELFLFAVESSLTPHHHFFGSEITKTILQKALEMPSISEVYAFLRDKGSGGEFHDIVEVCGGEARVSQVLISRRNYIVGPNFDIIAGIDL